MVYGDINKGNTHENCNQIKYTYKQKDKVLLKIKWKTKYDQDAYVGPTESQLSEIMAL